MVFLYDMEIALPQTMYLRSWRFYHHWLLMYICWCAPAVSWLKWLLGILWWSSQWKWSFRESGETRLPVFCSVHKADWCIPSVHATVGFIQSGYHQITVVGVSEELRVAPQACRCRRALPVTDPPGIAPLWDMRWSGWVFDSAAQAHCSVEKNNHAPCWKKVPSYGLPVWFVTLKKPTGAAVSKICFRSTLGPVALVKTTKALSSPQKIWSLSGHILVLAFSAWLAALETCLLFNFCCFAETFTF